jgi:hypothetical protein
VIKSAGKFSKFSEVNKIESLENSPEGNFNFSGIQAANDGPEDNAKLREVTGGEEDETFR